MASKHISTRFLIISDTHGEPLQQRAAPLPPVDVAIHCGDLTEESKLSEYKITIDVMKRIDAPLKIMIAGNHDFTLDDDAFTKKTNELKRLYAAPGDDIEDLIRKEYGALGEARALFEDASSSGIVFLAEGNHSFDLRNGAHLKLYCSPYTPSTNDWAFQYDPQSGHAWQVDHDVDVVITHGPPEGIFDRSPGMRKRLGCPDLFAAVCHARPRLHCFGHIHSCWGARSVAWRQFTSSKPSHMSAINHEASLLIEDVKCITADREKDDPEVYSSKLSRKTALEQQGYCHAAVSDTGAEDVSRTLFVNAAIKDDSAESQQLPWLVDISLPVMTQCPSDGQS